jgi:hypothetical protein
MQAGRLLTGSTILKPNSTTPSLSRHPANHLQRLQSSDTSFRFWKTMGVAQDLAALLRRRNLEGLLLFRHRELMGHNDIHIR